MDVEFFLELLTLVVGAIVIVTTAICFLFFDAWAIIHCYKYIFPATKGCW